MTTVSITTITTSAGHTITVNSAGRIQSCEHREHNACVNCTMEYAADAKLGQRSPSRYERECREGGREYADRREASRGKNRRDGGEGPPRSHRRAGLPRLRYSDAPLHPDQWDAGPLVVPGVHGLADADNKSRSGQPTGAAQTPLTGPRGEYRNV